MADFPTKLQKRGHSPDYFLMAVVFVISIFGLAVLASASSELGQLKFNDSYYYIKQQISKGLLAGILGFLVGYFFHYQRWRRWALVMLVGGLAALVLVFTGFGVEIRGASRWVDLGPVIFQPAEAMKLAFIVYLAAWLSNPKKKRATDALEGLLPFVFISGVIALLLVMQPATSTTAILLGAGVTVYFASGAKLKHVALVILIGVLSISLLVYATPYRKARVLGFLDQEADSRGTNYHINQALIALGSGGLTGAGYGQSATKTNYLPTPIDDSIFAVIGEEFGFLGAGAIVTLFALLVLRMFWLAKKTRDAFGRLMLVGFGAIIAFQSFVNMAAMSGLIPLTGVPLPFVSFGGTALATFLTMSGITLNVSKYT